MADPRFPRAARPRPALAALQAVATDLGDDELRVLTSIAKRLAFGAGVYGPLAIATDKRKFREKEAREELEDFLVYLACEWLRVLERSPTKRATKTPSRRR